MFPTVMARFGSNLLLQLLHSRHPWRSLPLYFLSETSSPEAVRLSVALKSA